MSVRRRVLLGGGIGSGKSTATGILAALGAEVMSADRAGHRVLAPGGAAARRVAARWPEVVREGIIDRAALGQVVFSDPVDLADLEAITHPAIRAEIEARIAACDAPVIVVESPLPIELLGPGWCWVVIDAPDEVRIERLLRRGMDRVEIRRRIAAQPSRQEWLDRADEVIANHGDLGSLEAECRRVWGLLAGG